MPSNQEFRGPEAGDYLKEGFMGEALVPRYADHLSLELIGAYAAGELNEQETLDVAAHLNGCAGCLGELNEMRAAWERLADRLSAALPEPNQLLESTPKLDLVRAAKGFLARHQPEALEFFDEIWELLRVKPLREIARARPQPVRGEPSGSQINVAVVAVLATILERERARRLNDISSLRLGALVERYASECGLTTGWAKQLREYLAANS